MANSDNSDNSDIFYLTVFSLLSSCAWDLSINRDWFVKTNNHGVMRCMFMWHNWELLVTPWKTRRTHKRMHIHSHTVATLSWKRCTSFLPLSWVRSETCLSFAVPTPGSHHKFWKWVHSSLKGRNVIEGQGKREKHMNTDKLHKKGKDKETEGEWKRERVAFWVDVSQVTGVGTRMWKLNGTGLWSWAPQSNEKPTEQPPVMDEALRSLGPDRFWESARAVSGPDKEIRGAPVRASSAAPLTFEVTGGALSCGVFCQSDNHYLHCGKTMMLTRALESHPPFWTIIGSIQAGKCPAFQANYQQTGTRQLRQQTERVLYRMVPLKNWVWGHLSKYLQLKPSFKKRQTENDYTALIQHTISCTFPHLDFQRHSSYT